MFSPANVQEMMMFTRCQVLCFTLLSLLSPIVATAGDPVRLKLTVNGDGVARHNAPVTASVDAKLPPDTFKTRAVAAVLTTDDGFNIPAHLERAGDGIVVRWVEPSLSADVGKTYTLTVDSS